MLSVDAGEFDGVEDGDSATSFLDVALGFEGLSRWN